MARSRLDSDGWPQLVERLGGADALTTSAREHKAFLRARGIKRAEDVLRLAFMYGPGGYSLRSLAALAAADGLADVSDVAMLERLRHAADWLQFLCEQALARIAQALDARTEHRPIRIVDSSRLDGPGDRTWRLHLSYDVGAARAVDARFTTLKEGDRLDRLAIQPGEIRLGDRGFPQPDGIKRTLDGGADVLVRLTWNSLQLTRSNGDPIDWLALFEQANQQGTLDLPVRMHKAHSRFQPVDLRLIVVRKPPAAAEQARAQARRASKHNQKCIDPRTLAAADHVVLLTSLAPEFSIERLSALYRLRWQIELAIKRMKSILHFDRLPAKDPGLVRTWFYAHLLLALLLDEKLAGLDAIPP